MDFAQLSGGLKEQLNAAVRMAIAHTLSEVYDGCLPLLFDDAFTNTDPVRLDVKSMLRQAVDLGLQVVLSVILIPMLRLLTAVALSF